MSIKYLIVGNKGQLGSEFEKKLSSVGAEYYGFDIDTLNIADLEATLRLLAAKKPSVVINCSAYNLVDDAETDFYSAFASNSLGVRNLAFACKKIDAFLVHYGSDYIFDGNKATSLYNEKDETNPLNMYGKSKLLGELFVADELENYLIFRLSWVYGIGRQNFIFKLWNWCREKDMLRIAFDEVSIPTHTGMIAELTLKSLEQGLSGIYHLTAGGYASRYEWAKYIIEGIWKKKNLLIPASKESFGLKASRPSFSAMSNEKISSALSIEIPDWKSSLAAFLKNYKLL